MSQQTAIYTGEDAELVIDLLDVNFADVQDVIVGFITNKQLQKTCKKSSNQVPHRVVAHGTDPKKCIARLFRSETKNWPKGQFTVEVTVVYNDVNFPDGRHIAYKEYLCEFDQLLTHNA